MHMDGMNFSMLLMGIVPLLAFVIVDSFFGLKAGLITASVLALAEAAFSLYKFGEVDMITGASFLLVLAMAFMSWKTGSEKFFLFQPVVLSALFGAYLVITYLIGRPFFLEFFMKYQDVMVEVSSQSAGVTLERAREMFMSERFQNIIRLQTMTVGIGFFFHAGATAFAAIKLNKWWWIAVRGIGFYVFFGLSAYAAILMSS